MANEVSDFNAMCDSLSSAIGDGDYAAAQTYLAQARVLLMKLPDSGAAGGGEIRYSRADLDNLSKEIRRLRTAAAVVSTGLRRTKLKRVEVED